MPSGATYCQFGPSRLSVQLLQVRPPSPERPKPLPTVPYHTALSLVNPNEFTKFHEMDVESFAFDAIRIQSSWVGCSARRSVLSRTPAPAVSPRSARLAALSRIARDGSVRA